MTARIEPARKAHLDGWALLRHSLWSEESFAEHRAEAEAQLAKPERFAAFVAIEEQAVVAFAEASIRRDYVNGCDTSPVLFLEGICVLPAHRRQGLARALCARLAAWGESRGCSEFASDAWHDDAESQAFHAAIGFTETERVVYFRKSLSDGSGLT